MPEIVNFEEANAEYLAQLEASEGEAHKELAYEYNVFLKEQGVHPFQEESFYPEWMV